VSATQLLVEANLKNAELQDSLTVVWARVAELEAELNEWVRMGPHVRKKFEDSQARVEVLEAKSIRHAEEIDEWKEASGIVTGSGDPADVTPRMASSYWNDIDRDLTKSQIKVEDLETELRMAKIGDEVGHKLLDIAIDDGAEKVAELISLRARVAELETQVKERFNAFKAEQARVEVLEARSDWCPVCNGGLPDQSGEGGSDA